MCNTDLRLSVLRAMLGEVTTNVAAIRGNVLGTIVALECFWFATPTQEDMDHFSDIAGQVIGDYPSPYKLDEQMILIDDMQDIGTPWMFLRAEAQDIIVPNRIAKNVQEGTR